MKLSSCHTTSTGIRIGIAHMPAPPREIGSEAEKVQAALLRRPSERSLFWRAVFTLFGPR
jgi:hypothetical protein